MITLTFGGLITPRIIAGPNWTYGGIGTGQFTANSGTIASTTTITLSETVLGAFFDVYDLWNFPENTRLVFTDTSGNISIFRWVSALMQAGPIVATVVFESSSQINWVGNYGVAFMFQTEVTTPSDLGTKNGSLILVTSLLAFIAYKASVNGSITIAVPSGVTPLVGAEIQLWLTPTGANRALSMAVGIKLPTLNPITFPLTLTQDLSYILTLIFNGTSWMLDSITGGF